MRLSKTGITVVVSVVLGVTFCSAHVVSEVGLGVLGFGLTLFGVVTLLDALEKGTPLTMSMFGTIGGMSPMRGMGMGMPNSPTGSSKIIDDYKNISNEYVGDCVTVCSDDEVSSMRERCGMMFDKMYKLDSSLIRAAYENKDIKSLLVKGDISILNCFASDDIYTSFCQAEDIICTSLTAEINCALSRYSRIILDKKTNTFYIVVSINSAFVKDDRKLTYLRV